MQDDIKFLEEVRFVLNKRQPICLQNLFGKENSILINRLVDEMSWPMTHNGDVIHQIVPFKMSNLHYNQWEVGHQLFEAIVNLPLEVPRLGYGWIYKIIFGQNLNKKNMKLQ